MRLRPKCTCDGEDWLVTGGINGHTFTCFRESQKALTKRLRRKFYPRHRIRRPGIYVRGHVWGWFFKLPILRRFDGFTLTPWDIVFRPGFEYDPALTAHELEHVRQWRKHWLMPVSYLLYGYDDNPFEILARQIAERARA